MIKKFTSMRTMILGATFMSAFMVSCRKDTLETTIDRADGASIELLLDKIDPEMQYFTIDPSQPKTITGSEGTVINIPENAFVDANGNKVTGNVTISLKEILSLKDQITSGVYAVSNGSLLKSGGEFFFEARANGQKLKLSENQFITFDVPADVVDPNMEVFVGEELREEDFTGSIVNWERADSSKFNTLVTDSIFNSNDSLWSTDSSWVASYQLDITMTGYRMKVYDIYNTSFYNCDRYYNYPNLIEKMPFTVVNLEISEDEIVDFNMTLVYKQLGSVIDGRDLTNMNWYHIVDNRFTGQINSTWLTGEDVVIIVVGVGKKSKKIYFGKTTLNIAANSNPSVSISVISDADLSAALDNL
jgi:hypothetical protein